MLTADGETIPARDLLGSSVRVRVKVIDFGLAKLAGDGKDSSVAGCSLPAPFFSNPGQRASDGVDSRSDVYSLGATLWYSLTGKLPCNRPLETPLPMDQLAGHDIPGPVIALLKSILTPAPANRSCSAVELTEALQRCLSAVSNATRFSRGRARRWALASGLGLVAALIGLAIYLTPASSSLEEKSIAVLPFRNLSDDPANAFLAEGVQDDILSRLVKIRDLKVISRLGTSRYAAEAPRDLRAIGRTLGARHLLEGSLRRDGNRVRLHVSLVDTRDGHEVWSDAY